MGGSVGGNGGAGGSSGDVTVTTTGGTISTFQVQSAGIFAQSVGGGGGAGGGAFTGSASVGGTGSVNASATIGGRGGSGGNSGEVNVTSGSSIVTRDFLSYGIFAQSVGGGGGSGGNALSGSISLGGSAGVNAGANLGGSGSGGGDGDDVTVISNGDYIYTLGSSYASGIFAQSIGGGGGTGGSSMSLSMTAGGSGSVDLGAVLGGKGERWLRWQRQCHQQLHLGHIGNTPRHLRSVRWWLRWQWRQCD